MNPLREFLKLAKRYSSNHTLTFNAALSSGSRSQFENHMEMLILLCDSIELCKNLSSEDDDLWESNNLLFSGAWNWLINPLASWTSVKAAPLDKNVYAGLTNLARVFDHARPVLPALSVEQVEGLRVAFEKIREIISSQEGVPENLVKHIGYLTNRGLSILDGETIDITALRSISFEVLGATVCVPWGKEHRNNINEAWTVIRNAFFGFAGDTAAGITSGAIVGLISS